MSATRAISQSIPPLSWPELVLPKEHGSWAFAFEPIALGLLIAPSAVCGWLALSMALAFFARRPLRTAMGDTRPRYRAAARQALIACGAGALLAFGAAIACGGFTWLPWLLPTAAAGAIFLGFDLQKAGREGVAETAGVAAFAFLPAAFLAAAGATSSAAVAAAVVMLGRAVPTVLCVRACLRAAKTGTHQVAPALIAALVALGAAIGLARAGLAPVAAAWLLAALAGRAALLLVFPRPALRARTLGIIETVIGISFVLVTAATWPR